VKRGHAHALFASPEERCRVTVLFLINFGMCRSCI